MNTAYLLIGGNMGNRLHYLSEARKAIGECCGKLTKTSSLYETAAWGIEDQSPFLNQALMITTSHGPMQLLECLLKIEEALGRKREVKYGPRTIDIDILFFNQDIINEPNLAVPHPQLPNRRFALQCLNEIASELQHPVHHVTIQQLLADCPDPLAVNKIN